MWKKKTCSVLPVFSDYNLFFPGVSFCEVQQRAQVAVADKPVIVTLAVGAESAPSAGEALSAMVTLLTGLCLELSLPRGLRHLVTLFPP